MGKTIILTISAIAFCCNILFGQNVSYEPLYEMSDLENRVLDQELIVGKTPSNQSVSSTGAFTYNIPIDLPQGINGSTPSVSINYSSQGGNGIVGFGWGIAAGSSISRVNYDHFHEDELRNIFFDSNDQLAYDGNRLVLESGTHNTNGAIYKTESETYSLITAHNQIGSGPEYFTVETKDGRILEFGKTANSRVTVSHQNSTHVLSWNLNKISDLYDNYIEYVYQMIDNQQLLKEINYSGNSSVNSSPFYSIKFTYEKREDKGSGYFTEVGTKINSQHLLTEIDIIHIPTQTSYKRYEFKYAFNFYSYLNEVIEYGKLNSTEHLNTLRFSYHDASPTYTKTPTNLDNSDFNYYPGDFNGDGLTDVLLAQRHLNSNNYIEYSNFFIRLNNGNGYSAMQNLAFIPTFNVLLGQGMNSDYIRATGMIYFDIGDFNGDGKDDITWALGYKEWLTNHVGVSQIAIAHSNSEGQSVQFHPTDYYQPASSTHNRIGTRNSIFKGDFNGDGALDLFLNLNNRHKDDYQHKDNEYQPQIIYPKVSPIAQTIDKQGDNFSYNKMSFKDILYVLDFNGNGKSDLMQIYEHKDVNRTVIREYKNIFYHPATTLYDDNHGSSGYQNFPHKNHDVRIGDFNGDGKADIMYSENGSSWNFRMSNGIDFIGILTNPSFPTTDHYYNELIVADFNGDGRSDIKAVYEDVNSSTSVIEVHFIKEIENSGNFQFESTSNNFGSLIVPSPQTTNSWGSNAYFLGDYDGDGILEMMARTNIFTNFKVVDFDKEITHGKISGISTGFNEFSKINYSTISFNGNTTCRNLYEKGTNASSPLIDFQKPILVTSEVETPDQSGTNSKQSFRSLSRYFYKGAKFHTAGLGFLGFIQVETTNEIVNGNEAYPISLASQEFEFDLSFFFSRLKKSHLSQISYNNYTNGMGGLPCESDKVIIRNLNSTINQYTTFIYSGSRFINQLDETQFGDNVKGFTQLTNYDYSHVNATKHGNVTSITIQTGSQTEGYSKHVTEFEYDAFGTHIPSAITKKVVKKTRNTLADYIEHYEYDYNLENDLIRLDRKYPNTQTNVYTETFEYNNYGNLIRTTEDIPNRGGTNFIETIFNYSADERFMIKDELYIDKSIGHQYENHFTYEPLSGIVLASNTNAPLEGMQFSYNEFYQKTSQVDDYGNLTNYTTEWNISNSTLIYEAQNSLYTVTKSKTNSSNSKKWFNHLGKMTKSELEGFSGNIYQTEKYTSVGQVSLKTDPFFNIQVKNTHQFEYDDLNRLIRYDYKDQNGQNLNYTTYQLVAPLNVQPFSFSNRTYVEGVNHADGTYKLSKMDASGHLIESTDDGGTIEYTYYSNGQIDKTIVNGLEMSSATYDAFGHQSSLTEVNSGTTTYQYNVIGELTAQTDAKGNTISNIQYDALGRMTHKNMGITGNSSLHQYSFVFNNDPSTVGFGKLESENVSSNMSFSDTYFYNSNGELTEVRERAPGNLPDFITKYEYLGDGRVDKVEYHQAGQVAVKIAYEYTTNGYLYKVKDQSGILDDPNRNYFEGIEQNEMGQWTEYMHLDGKLVSKMYDASHRPSEVIVQDLKHRQYAFDANSGNLMNRTNVLQQNEEEFEYDNLDRLIVANLNGSPFQTNTYQTNGNISEFGDDVDYIYDAEKVNALVKVGSPSSWQSFNSQVIEYNEKNDPKTIGIPDQKEWEYFYGPNHERRYVNMKDFSLSPQQWQQRVYTSNAEYLFEGPDLKSQTIYIQGGDGLAAIVNYNADGDDLTMAYATHLDYLGSLEILSKEDGSLFYEQSFDAWGKIRNPDTWQFDPNYQANQPNWLWRGYTSHEMLYEFDLIHMNGRLYDPFVGRMLSPDNFVQDATSTQNYNRYSYVVNNPLKYTDPSGEFLTWSIGNGGFSIGFNLTPIGIPVGGGYNFGFSNGFSAGVYGEVGYRVGGTGFGAGATASQSLDYNFKHKDLSTTTSVGAYASFGPATVGGNVYLNHSITHNQTNTGWGVFAGVGVGNERGGMGLFVGYGSNGWSYGLNGYYNPNVDQSRYNVVLTAEDDGTYSEQTAQTDFLDGRSRNDGNHSTNLRNNPNVLEVQNPDGTYTYTLDVPKRHRINGASAPSSTVVLSQSNNNRQYTFTTLDRANTMTFMSSRPYSGNYVNFRNYQPYPTSIHYNSILYRWYDR